MKILFVSELYPSENRDSYCIFLEQQAQALLEIGNEVDVLHLHQKDEDGEKVNSVNQNGITVYHFDYRLSKIRSLVSLSYKIPTCLENFLRNGKYDVISFHILGLPLIFGIGGIAKELGIPTLVHFHGLNIWGNAVKSYKERLYNIYENRVRKAEIKSADAIVGVSNKVGETLKKGIECNNYYTVYNGVNPDIFFPCERQDKDVFTIVTIGNLIQLKGHDYLIEAFAEAVQKCPQKHLRLMIIGDGPQRDALVKLCEEKGISDFVTFTGNLAYSEIAVILREQADLFVLASYFEALGCVYLEAMASGVAAVGVKGCGIDEIITDNETVFLVSPKNAAELSQYMIGAITDREKLSRVAKAGCELVRNGYTWRDSADKLQKVYKDVLERQK